MLQVYKCVGYYILTHHTSHHTHSVTSSHTHTVTCSARCNRHDDPSVAKQPLCGISRGTDADLETVFSSHVQASKRRPPIRTPQGCPERRRVVLIDFGPTLLSIRVDLVAGSTMKLHAYIQTYISVVCLYFVYGTV